MISVQTFEAGEAVGHYCGKIVYRNLRTQKQIRKTYGDGVTFVTVDNFLCDR